MNEKSSMTKKSVSKKNRALATLLIAILLCTFAINIKPAHAEGTQGNKPLFTGYWQNWNGGSNAANLRLREVPEIYDIVAISFGINSASGVKGQVDFALDAVLCRYLEGYNEEEFKQDIHTLQERGQKVILSIGGATGQIVVDDNNSAQEFASSVDALIDEYGFDGIDIDLENTIYPEYLAYGINLLYDGNPNATILTLAPQTVDFKMQRNGTITGTYYDLIQRIKDKVTIVNMQMYNTGSQYGQDRKEYFPKTVDFITGVTAVLLESGLEESQVGIGVHYLGETKRGVTPENTVIAFNSLVSGQPVSDTGYQPLRAYPNLGGIMIWSINGDAKYSYQYTEQFESLIP